jgi:hypothetical protein
LLTKLETTESPVRIKEDEEMRSRSQEALQKSGRGGKDGVNKKSDSAMPNLQKIIQDLGKSMNDHPMSKEDVVYRRP